MLLNTSISNNNIFYLWSWRDSNPRPNEEATGFLHAYPRFIFRAPAGSEPPTGTLALVNFTKLPEQHPG
jgi:hypothetical protein